eukprot:1191442-Prorocentrum_minimum.AAC.2
MTSTVHIRGRHRPRRRSQCCQTAVPEPAVLPQAPAPHRALHRQHAGLAAGRRHRQHGRPDVYLSRGHAPRVPGRSNGRRVLVAQLPMGRLPEAMEPTGVVVHDAGVVGTRRDGARARYA